MKSGIFSVGKDNVKKILDGIALLPQRDVLVGIPEAEADRKNDEESHGVTNAQIGYAMEFGVPELNVPARPSLIPGVRNAKVAVVKYFRQAGTAALAGDKAKIDRAMNAAGMAASTSVKNKIRTGPFAPLAQSTIDRRRRRSKGSSYRRKAATAAQVRPLIDTGQFLAAHTYVVRDRT